MRSLLAAVLLAVPVLADEGMWTFDNPPVDLLRKNYNFTPTREWLDHLRLASARLNDGGSGSFAFFTGSPGAFGPRQFALYQRVRDRKLY